MCDILISCMSFLSLYSRTDPSDAIYVALQLATSAIMLIMLAAGVTKMLQPDEFLSAVATWDILPAEAAPFAAFWIPQIEIVLAALWFLRLWPVVSLLGLCGFFATSIVIAAASRAGDNSFECGCTILRGSHPSGPTEPMEMITRNVLMLAVVALTMIVNITRRRITEGEVSHESIN